MKIVISLLFSMIILHGCQCEENENDIWEKIRQWTNYLDKISPITESKQGTQNHTQEPHLAWEQAEERAKQILDDARNRTEILINEAREVRNQCLQKWQEAQTQKNKILKEAKNEANELKNIAQKLRTESEQQQTQTQNKPPNIEDSILDDLMNSNGVRIYESTESEVKNGIEHRTVKHFNYTTNKLEKNHYVRNWNEPNSKYIPESNNVLK